MTARILLPVCERPQPTLAAMVLSTLLTVVRGFAMGAADIVPGVSGGTIALVFGIYERLIASVKAGSSALGHLVKGDLEGFKRWFGTVEWSFILPLLGGIALAIISLAHLIETLLHDEPVLMAAVFLGLVAGSVVIAVGLIQERHAVHLWIAIGVGIVVFVMLGFRGGTSEDTVAQATDPALLAFFIAGAIAICAMILPGVSGSFLLVVLGMYEPVLSAVTDRDLAPLAVFMVGAVVGLALFSQVLHWALQHHHDVVMARLIGLMAGSVRVLWPWPNGVFTTELGKPDSDVVPAIILAVVAFILVWWVSGIAQRLAASEAAASESPS